MSYEKSYPFQFTGRGSEYFKIWSVNIILTLLTFGIYSAWATVRTLRWFYGHTLLDNHSFSYLATPMQILKGRLIALAMLVLYYLASLFVPVLAVVLAICFVVATPWIVVSSLRFHARYSAYRGLRFDFTGRVGEAAIIFLLLPILMIPTLGLVLPYMAYRQVKFIANNSVYGQTNASYEGSLKPFWSIYLLAFILMLAPLGVIGYGAIQIFQLQASGAPEEEIGAAVGALSVGIALLYLMIVIVSAMVKARTANLFYNHTVMGPVGFSSNQRARDLIWIYASNLLLIALTLGIFIPWAMVRLARYRAQRLILNGPQTLDGFVAGQQQTDTATGAEVAGMFDVDVGLA